MQHCWSVLHFVEQWKAWRWRWCIFAFHHFASRWQHLPRNYCARTNTRTRALTFDRAWLRQTHWHANSINAKPHVAKAPATCVFQLHTCTQKWLHGSQVRLLKQSSFLRQWWIWSWCWGSIHLLLIVVGATVFVVSSVASPPWLMRPCVWLGRILRRT